MASARYSTSYTADDFGLCEFQILDDSLWTDDAKYAAVDRITFTTDFQILNGLSVSVESATELSGIHLGNYTTYWGKFGKVKIQIVC